jgi:D-aminopeptidase
LETIGKSSRAARWDRLGWVAGQIAGEARVPGEAISGDDARLRRVKSPLRWVETKRPASKRRRPATVL